MALSHQDRAFPQRRGAPARLMPERPHNASSLHPSRTHDLLTHPPPWRRPWSVRITGGIAMTAPYHRLSRKAAFSSTVQTSMSARARRASASPSRPISSEHATAKYCTCHRLAHRHVERLNVLRRWVVHGATGTEWGIWRVVNPHGTCTRQMGALDRLDWGQGRRQGPVRLGAPAARSTLRPDCD